MNIPERDWKILRDMKDEKLDIACERIMNKIRAVIDRRDDNGHKKYLSVWKMLRKEDRGISIMFDEVKRSTALFKLAAWQRNNLLTNAEFNRFSEQTRNTVTVFNKP